MKKKVKIIFILGQPRAGSTTLANILAQHPNIFLPKIKEPHFFIPEKDQKYLFDDKGRKVFFKKLGFIDSLEDYKKNYNFFKDTNKVYIDGSTLYCSNLQSIGLILKCDWIEPFFVLSTREKSMRAVSHYLYSKSRGEEYRSFEQCLKDEINGVYKGWLINGYMNGSNDEQVSSLFKKLQIQDKLVILNLDSKEFNQNKLDIILEKLELSRFIFSTDIRTNELFLPSNKIVLSLRLFALKLRRVNPFIFDNIVTRRLYLLFRRGFNKGTQKNENIEELKIVFNKYWGYYIKN